MTLRHSPPEAARRAAHGTANSRAVRLWRMVAQSSSGRVRALAAFEIALSLAVAAVAVALIAAAYLIRAAVLAVAPGMDEKKPGD